MKISVIGFGRFGKFMVKNLKEKLEIIVTDTSDKSKEAEEMGVKFVSLNEALKNKIIILAVPMEKLSEILHKIKNKLLPGTLVLDICSLKMFSCNAMKNILPKDVEIIGTHPLFGPQSTPNGLKGMKMALCRVRSKEETFNKVKEFCDKLELNTFIVSPEEHDKQMAISQALTHFIGQTAKAMGLERVELSTKTFDDLMNINDIIKNDTEALFNNMQVMNPFAKEAREKFVNASIDLNSKLNNLSKVGVSNYREKI